MTISLGPQARQALEERMKRGGYATADEAILAGMASLDQEEAFGAFAPGELDALLAEGEADIQAGALLDVDEAFTKLSRHR